MDIDVSIMIMIKEVEDLADVLFLIVLLEVGESADEFIEIYSLVLI